MAGVELFVAISFLYQEAILDRLPLPRRYISIRLKILKLLTVICNYIFEETFDTIINFPKVFITAPKLDGVPIDS